MKTTIKIILLSIILSFTFSCTKDVSNDIGKINVISLNELQKLAIEHNNAMDFVLQGLRTSNNINYNNVDSVVNSNLSLFYKSRFISSSLELESAINFSKLESNRLSTQIKKVQKISASDETPIQKVINEYSENLSNTQKEFLNKIDIALNLEAELAAIELNKIEIDAQNKLSKEDALPILAGIEIGKASITYWNENFSSWYEALNTSAGSSKVRIQKATNKFSWRNLFASDIAGAIGGAVTTAVINALPGAGQVAYGGAILGGAAGGSATYAVYEALSE